MFSVSCPFLTSAPLKINVFGVVPLVPLVIPLNLFVEVSINSYVILSPCMHIAAGCISLASGNVDASTTLISLWNISKFAFNVVAGATVCL